MRRRRSEVENVTSPVDLFSCLLCGASFFPYPSPLNFVVVAFMLFICDLYIYIYIYIYIGYKMIVLLSFDCYIPIDCICSGYWQVLALLGA